MSNDVMRTIALTGVIPTISVENPSDVVPVCRALKSGGVGVVEITLRTQSALEALAQAVREVPDMVIGAGTILEVEQLKSAEQAGAAFFVTPGCNPEVMQYASGQRLPIVPGCATGTEIEAARSFGITTVKIFPAEQLGGVGYLRALAAPYRDVQFVPMGGVNAGNLRDYLAFDRVAACGGSWIASTDLIRNGDMGQIETNASEAMTSVLGVGIDHVGINASDETTARSIAEKLAQLVSGGVRPGNSSIFAGSEVEVLKAPGRGERGHIGLKCSDLQRLIFHLEGKGVELDKSSIKFRNGRPFVIFLADEIGGFAIHFVERSGT